MTVQKEGKRNAGTTNVFSEGELDRGSTVAKNATTQFENGNRKNNVHFFHDNGVKSVIGRHINNVYKEKELTRDITCANFAHIGTDADQTCYTTLYNLDVIISVGYRVKSQRGMQFRIWANRVLKDYFVKGYAVNERIHKEQIGELRTDR